MIKVRVFLLDTRYITINKTFMFLLFSFHLVLFDYFYLDIKIDRFLLDIIEILS